MAAASTLFSSVGLPGWEATTWVEAGSKLKPLVTGRVHINFNVFCIIPLLCKHSPIAATMQKINAIPAKTTTGIWMMVASPNSVVILRNITRTYSTSCSLNSIACFSGLFQSHNFEKEHRGRCYRNWQNQKYKNVAVTLRTAFLHILTGKTMEPNKKKGITWKQSKAYQITFTFYKIFMLVKYQNCKQSIL